MQRINPSYEPIHNTTATGVNRRTLLLTQGYKTLGSLPPAIDKLGSIFADAGHEVSLVRGPIRDAFLGLPTHDLGLTTSAPLEIIERLFSSWGAAAWDTGQEFGTIGSIRDGATAEVTTYQPDSHEVGSRRPKADFGHTLEGGFSRYDLTINAMAVRLPEFELVNPYGGLGDLIGGVLRTPVTVVQSFDDNSLRIMYAARFATQLGFGAGEDVVSTMAEMAERLTIVSTEQIRAELERLVLSPAPCRGIKLLVYTGVVDIILPEIAQLRETVGEHKRHKDVYEHMFTVVDRVITLEDPASKEKYRTYLLGGELEGPDLMLRLTALFHGVGKPRTRRFEKDGSITFRAHGVIGARMAAKRTAALCFDKRTEKDVARLIELHLCTFGLSEAGWTDSAVRRFMRGTRNLLPCLIRLIRAGVTSQDRRKIGRLQTGDNELAARIRDLIGQEALDAIRPDLDGARIMEILGLKPGPKAGAARNYPLELRLNEGPLSEEGAERHLLA